MVKKTSEVCEQCGHLMEELQPCHLDALIVVLTWIVVTRGLFGNDTM